ncbi:helix-turn-helix domain-containing protein [Nocardia sp. NPDC088792]|uniref:helix-turn-helix domain-containing protein n=1 Tax=Nocardia sp. NPDC088792 TaxID=3364332 RepID=UPI00380F546C
MKEVIEDADLSVRTAAERSGIPRETLRRRLDGLAPFDIDELEKLAAVLSVESDAFLDSQRWPDLRDDALQGGAA